MSIEEKKEKWEIKLHGDLDINTSPELKKGVLDIYRKEAKPLVFDLENLKYLDSTGLGAFISIHKNARELDHSISFVKVKPNIKKLFTITELDKIFSLED